MVTCSQWVSVTGRGDLEIVLGTCDGARLCGGGNATTRSIFHCHQPRTNIEMTSRIRSAGGRQTGLQKEVLKLYRSFLGVIRAKPSPARPGLHKYVGDQFRDNAKKIQAKDITAVEFLLRKARKSLEMLEDPNTQGVSVNAPAGWTSPVFRTDRPERPPLVKPPPPKKDSKSTGASVADSAGFPAPR